MIELLAAEKRERLAEDGHVTLADFDQAWNHAWEVMVAEHAWPHATQHRRGWRQAMIATRTEARAAWLDQPSAFATTVQRLTVMHGGPLEPKRVPRVILGLMEFVAAADRYLDA